MSESVLSLRDLRVTYSTSGGGVPAVRGVDLDVGKGEVVGLAGESGCGKSTIAGAILRLLPDRTKIEGQALLGDEDILTMRLGRLRAVRWQEASIIFQGAMHGLNPVQTVGHQVAEAILTHNPGEAAAKKRVAELFEQVGLTERRIKDYPHELSGGQKQRVMIAMALALDPQIIIADEPTTALDVMVQAQVLRLLKRLQAELGMSMIFITHDLSVLVEVCDRIAVMYAGKLVEIGPAEQVFDNPLHPYTKALANAFPDIGDSAFRKRPVGLGGDPPDPQYMPSGCPFHPRCPAAIEACASESPQLVRIGAAPRQAACLLLNEETSQ